MLRTGARLRTPSRDSKSHKVALRSKEAVDDSTMTMAGARSRATHSIVTTHGQLEQQWEREHEEKA